jgi:ESCRT-II complex subunit VPS36
MALATYSVLMILDRLLHTVESSTLIRQTDMSDALQDLEALMVKARDMVRLAGELNDRLTASSSLASNPYSSTVSLTPSGTTLTASAFSSTSTLVPSTEPEEATFIRSSLAQLGLHMENTPVTLDMIRDEKRWHEELARELAAILQGTGTKGAVGIMRERGIVGLDEVWGGWNRARGVGEYAPISTIVHGAPLTAT